MATTTTAAPIVKKKVVIKKVIPEANTTTPAPALSKKKVVTKKVAPVKTQTKKTPKTSKAAVKTDYPLVGQRKPTPPPTDSLRKFYTSLLQQNPNSEMAKQWCIERGLLPGQRSVPVADFVKLTI